MPVSTLFKVAASGVAFARAFRRLMTTQTSSRKLVVITLLITSKRKGTGLRTGSFQMVASRKGSATYSTGAIRHHNEPSAHARPRPTALSIRRLSYWTQRVATSTTVLSSLGKTKTLKETLMKTPLSLMTTTTTTKTTRHSYPVATELLPRLAANLAATLDLARYRTNLTDPP